MLDQNAIKQKLGIYAADFVQQDMVIGLGTGTTIFYLLNELGKRKQQGLYFTAVCTSFQTQNILEGEGIEYVTLNDVDKLQLTIDGADEADAKGNLIKGGGGALLQEKIVASASDELIIIIDETKEVETLGAFPLPVEVITFGWKQVQQKIKNRFHIDCRLRKKEDTVFVTDHGHYILDCSFHSIKNPEHLFEELKLITGVVETGLFVQMATKIVIGYANGNIHQKTINH